MKFTTRFHIALSLRIRADIHLLPPYVFMACIKTFLLTFTDVKHSRRLCDFRLSPHVNEVFTILEYSIALIGN